MPTYILVYPNNNRFLTAQVTERTIFTFSQLIALRYCKRVQKGARKVVTTITI